MCNTSSSIAENYHTQFVMLIECSEVVEKKVYMSVENPNGGNSKSQQRVKLIMRVMWATMRNKDGMRITQSTMM